MRLAAALMSAATFAVYAGACSLPQDSVSDPSDTTQSDSSGPTEIRTWRMLRLEDLGASDDGSPMPGADIDAIAAFIDGDFLFAGCDSPSLFDTDPDVLAESEHSEAATATLHARDQTGYFSLAGGVLICELPVPITTGTVVEIWELSADGSETWRAAVADSAIGDYEDAGTVTGSGTFVAP